MRLLAVRTPVRLPLLLLKCEEFGHTTTPVGVQQEMDVDGMVHSDRNLFGDNESVFKIPHTKRKPKDSKGAKPKKMQANKKGGRESDSDRESSDSSIPDGQRSNGYSLEQEFFGSNQRKARCGYTRFFSLIESCFLIQLNG